MPIARTLSLLVMLCLFLFVVGSLIGCSCGNDDDDNDTEKESDDDDSGDDDDDNDDNDDDDDDNDDDNTPETTEGFGYAPSGVFTMGSPPNESGRKNDETQHQVTLLHAFEMSEMEITQGQFEETLGYNPSHFPFGEDPSDYPVDSASWYDALAYANRFSESLSYAPCYTITNVTCADETPGDTVDYCKDNGGIHEADVTINAVSIFECEGFRLPTEAEWEYAVRAGSNTAFYNGQITQTACSLPDQNLSSIGWYCGNSQTMTHPVGGKQPNAWNLFDMSGNVREWVWDWYERDFGGAATDPEGPTSGHFRVVRGGAVRYDGAGRCRSAYRTGQTPDHRSWYLGFRLARTLTDSKAGSKKLQDFTVHIKASKSQQKSPGSWPTALPFTFTRPQAGTPLTPTEVTEFTRKITGFWKDVGYFDWMTWISYGMGPNGDGYPEYKEWFGGVAASKSNDVVTFTHVGFDDNFTIGMCKALNNIISGYLMSSDPALGQLIKDWSLGLSALYKGMIWDSAESDPVHTLQPRTIYTRNHTYVQDGRETQINYDPVKYYQYDWNAHTIPNDYNPYWGPIWIRNMRSKDDMPHIFRSVPLLQRVVEEGIDTDVVTAAEEALGYLQNFARDIVDSGYYIRTKDEWGNTYVPVDEYGLVVDLASFVQYEFIVPKAECNAKLNAALIGYGESLDLDCGNGIGGIYENLASYFNYYNWAIIRYFHSAALHNALMVGEDTIAYDLMVGMAKRADTMMHDPNGPAMHTDWFADVAAFLLTAAGAGLPLTDEEAQLIKEHYSQSVDHYLGWAYWDPWDPSVPDGAIEYRPSRWGGFAAIHDDEMIFLLEYCYSPFRNPANAALVDCAVVADPSQWGL